MKLNIEIFKNNTEPIRNMLDIKNPKIIPPKTFPNKTDLMDKGASSNLSKLYKMPLLFHCRSLLPYYFFSTNIISSFSPVILIKASSKLFDSVFNLRFPGVSTVFILPSTIIATVSHNCSASSI